MPKKTSYIFVGMILFVIACGTSAAPTQIPTAVPPASEEPSAPPSPAAVEPTAVQHQMMPGDLPAEPSGRAGDQDSSTTAAENRAPSGDRFTFGRFERPFSPNDMEVYYSNIDIVATLFYQDDTWLYAVLAVKDDGSGKILDGKYGFEIDTNQDGGGDWLILVSEPASTQWTTGGVQVWQDENNDVGGSARGVRDNNPNPGDGFEKKVFGDGTGDDPDLAFARVSPDDPYTVQIAVKRSILGGISRFMVGMWAGNEQFDPAMFDHNDRFTHEQAGSPLKEFEFFYPIKAVYELDNTCRMAVGFQPTGGEPGICPLPPRPDGGEPPSQPSCPPQYVVCFNFGAQTVCYCTQP